MNEARREEIEGDCGEGRELEEQYIQNYAELRGAGYMNRAVHPAPRSDFEMLEEDESERPF